VSLYFSMKSSLPALLPSLRRRGHDVTAVAAEPQLRSMSDPELYAWATAGGRRIVTENVKEFRRLLMQEREPTGSGLLFTRRSHIPAESTCSRVAHQCTRQLAHSSAGVDERPPEGWLLPDGSIVAFSTLRSAAAQQAAAAESTVLQQGTRTPPYWTVSRPPLSHASPMRALARRG